MDLRHCWRLELTMGAAGPSAEEVFLKVLPLAVHSHTSKQERVKGSQQKNSGELGLSSKFQWAARTYSLAKPCLHKY